MGGELIGELCYLMIDMLICDILVWLFISQLNSARILPSGCGYED